MKKFSDALVIGLALFSMFFGAGNLIFPPYLGMTSGSSWVIGFIVYFIFDIGLAICGIFAMMKNDCKLSDVTGQVGKIPSLIVNIILVVCIGPVFVIPRTAATTFEMLSSVNILPQNGLLVFSLIYFIVVIALTIRPTKVVDIVGKVLTPILFFGLAFMIIYGIANPLGPVSDTAMVDGVVKQGVTTGYQTMDIFGGLVLSGIMIDSVIRKGYKSSKSQNYIIGAGCVIASVLLLFVYGGLTYLGATTSTLYDASIERASLLVQLTNGLFGQYGTLALCIIVASACVTTAIGFTSSCADYFEDLSKKKVSYKVIVLISTFVSFLISNLGLTNIIAVAGPILNFTFPIVLVMITLAIFKKYKNKYVEHGAIIVTFVISSLSVINSLGYEIEFLKVLPMFDYDLQWIIPAVIGGALGGIIGEIVKATSKADKKTGHINLKVKPSEK